jgi:hypothetical protein
MFIHIREQFPGPPFSPSKCQVPPLREGSDPTPCRMPAAPR